jgi:hypothetical protein
LGFFSPREGGAMSYLSVLALFLVQQKEADPKDFCQFKPGTVWVYNFQPKPSEKDPKSGPKVSERAVSIVAEASKEDKMETTLLCTYEDTVKGSSQTSWVARGNTLIWHGPDGSVRLLEKGMTSWISGRDD